MQFSDIILESRDGKHDALVVVTPPDRYSSMGEDLLKELAVSRGVAVEGGVDVLRAGLREHDQ
jgi:hypothetical protein